MSDMTRRLLEMQAQLDAILGATNEGLREVGICYEPRPARMNISWDVAVKMGVSKLTIDENLGMMFSHPERIQITRFEVKR